MSPSAGGVIDSVGGIADSSGHDGRPRRCGTHPGAARPAHRHVAGLGELEQAGVAGAPGRGPGRCARTKPRGHCLAGSTGAWVRSGGRGRDARRLGRLRRRRPRCGMRAAWMPTHRQGSGHISHERGGAAQVGIGVAGGQVEGGKNRCRQAVSPCHSRGPGTSSGPGRLQQTTRCARWEARPAGRGIRAANGSSARRRAPCSRFQDDLRPDRASASGRWQHRQHLGAARRPRRRPARPASSPGKRRMKVPRGAAASSRSQRPARGVCRELAAGRPVFLPA